MQNVGARVQPLSALAAFECAVACSAQAVSESVGPAYRPSAQPEVTQAQASTGSQQRRGGLLVGPWQQSYWADVSRRGSQAKGGRVRALPKPCFQARLGVLVQYWSTDPLVQWDRTCGAPLGPLQYRAQQLCLPSHLLTGRERERFSPLPSCTALFPALPCPALLCPALFCVALRLLYRATCRGPLLCWGRYL